jgi:hypothetical protein
MIGQGAFARVYKGKYKEEDVAIKVFSESSVAFRIEDFYKEVAIMWYGVYFRSFFRFFLSEYFICIEEFFPWGLGEVQVRGRGHKSFFGILRGILSGFFSPAFREFSSRVSGFFFFSRGLGSFFLSRGSSRDSLFFFQFAKP